MNERSSPGPLVVLGMHRSGTSTVTRLLALAGAPLPRGAGRGRRVNPNNPEGFWEVPALSRCNEQVLRALDGHWSSPPPLPPGWPDDVRLDRVRQRADRLAHRYLDQRGIVWKDPRLCLVLPFWAKYVSGDAPVVLVLRNPLEVAASIRARDRIDERVGLALWEHYTRSAIALADGRPVLVVRYEQVLDDPVGVVADARDWLATVGLPTGPAATAAAAAEFAREALRRNRRDDDDVERDPLLSEAQRGLHRAGVALVGRHDRFTPPPLPPLDNASIALLGARREARQGRHVRRSWPRRGRRWALRRLSDLARSRRGPES
jgi:hypothetical protein